jgi:hypothetical protein
MLLVVRHADGHLPRMTHRPWSSAGVVMMLLKLLVTRWCADAPMRCAWGITRNR